MTLSLACAWQPRGELPRFQKQLPLLREVYTSIAVSLPPDAPSTIARALEENVRVVITREWAHGRHAALAAALEANADFIHYADFDRLVHWVETRPDEWRAVVAQGGTTDCLIVGRSKRAYATHPRALIETEAISSAVVSHLLGRSMDVSAGAKFFSRRAAEYLVAHSAPGRALGMDAEWTLLLQRGGFRVDYVEVDGLDWESADRHLERAADVNVQRRAAEAYDADARHWARRVEIAMEIVQAGLNAIERPRPLSGGTD